MELVKKLQKKSKNQQNISNNENYATLIKEKISKFSPIRTCVVCKTKTDKKQLNRLVFLNNEIIIDLKHKLNSYGYYLCDNELCQTKINKILSKKKLKRIEIES